jgi:hypothetical protein
MQVVAFHVPVTDPKRCAFRPPYQLLAAARYIFHTRRNLCWDELYHRQTQLFALEL